MVHFIVCFDQSICTFYPIASAIPTPSQLVDDQVVYIHPSSALFSRQPEWVVYHKIVQTTKKYMREVTPIHSNWLVEFAPAFFKYQNLPLYNNLLTLQKFVLEEIKELFSYDHLLGYF
uniref:DEAD-box helicase OB fold domain-containing protein n=1 Tax=Strigamia maritima TaxID=126957 RepID=T1IJJ9_STRMM